MATYRSELVISLTVSVRVSDGQLTIHDIAAFCFFRDVYSLTPMRLYREGLHLMRKGAEQFVFSGVSLR
jgi:hypothetical protein